MALILPLAWEPPHATGVALKKKKKKYYTIACFYNEVLLFLLFGDCWSKLEKNPLVSRYKVGQPSYLTWVFICLLIVEKVI